jgi:uncharacterized membrane protein
MKSLVSSTIVMVGWLTCTTAFAQSLAYTFVTVDIPVPGRPGSFAFPKDINDEGVIVTTIVSDGAQAVIAEPVKRKSTEFNTTAFRCADVTYANTEAFSVNARLDVAGYCDPQPNGPKLYGFIRDRKRNLTLLDFPGADHTIAFGIGSDGQVVGQYYNPQELNRSGLFRIHGFNWNAGRFETVDFPLANTYTTLWSVNKRGQIIGEYYRFEPTTNEILGHNWFIYDNGQFYLDFPPSLEWMGGPAVYLADMNDAGQVIGARSNGVDGWNGIFLYEAGTFFDIPLPAEFDYAEVRGMNGKGQFVGFYLKEIGIDPYYGWRVYETHGYIATPLAR